MMKQWASIIVWAWCGGMVALVNAAEWKAPGPNIALKKPYVLQGDAAKNYGNYKLTEGNDDRDLTDGKLAEADSLWIDKASVAWSPGPRFMTFDLGKVQPIAGVGYRAGARGASGVTWPPFLLVMVSDDGKEFRMVGELVGLSSKFGAPPDEGRFQSQGDEYNEKVVKNPKNRALSQPAEPPYWFRTDELATHGRYVRLVVQSSLIVCTDEVEIYAGKPEHLKAAVKGTVVEKPIEYAQANAMPFAISARLATDAARAIALVDKLKIDAAAHDKVVAKLNQLRQRALKVDFKEYDLDFRAIVPLGPLHAEIFTALGEAYRAAGYPEFTLWHSNPWSRQSPFDLPPALADGKPAEAKLDVHTLHNDRRGEVMNLGNFSDRGKTALITFEGLPGGAKPEYVRVRQAEYLAMFSRVWDADPLPLAESTGAGWKVSLPAGVSRQLWFDFKPDTKNCPAGKHEGNVVVQIEGGPKLSFPITLTVGNYRLPEFKDRALGVGVWDYTDMGGWGGLLGPDKKTGAASKNLAAAIEHMQESGVNAPWGRSDWKARGTFPRPKAAKKGEKVEITQGMPLHKRVGIPYDTGGEDLFDAQGNLRVKLDFTAFDAWVKAWPNAKYYMIHAQMDWSYAGAKGSDWAREGFSAADKAKNDEVQRRIRVVMKAWADHMRKTGVDPNRIGLLLVDEPMYSSQARMTTFWAKPIKEAVPEFKIFTDPRVKPDYFENPDVVEMFERTDIITPGTDYNYHWLGQEAVDYYDKLREKGKILGFYSCAQTPSQGESAIYFRAQQWDCWRISKGGPESWAGIWSYSDFRTIRPWNALPGGTRDHTWCIAYIDSTSATDGKHWLAIFEGANDYAYMQTLKKRIAELEKSGEKTAEVAAAKKVLAEVPNQVFDAAHWQNQVDACDVGRLKVLAALETLAPDK